MEMESHPLWPIYNPLEDSTLDEIGLYFAEMGTQLSSFEFSNSSHVSIEDFSDISSSTLLPSTLHGNETYSNYPFLGNHFPGNYLPSLGCGDSPSSDQFMLDGSENLPELMTYESSNSSQQIFSEDFSSSSSQNLQSPISGEVSVEIPSIQASLVLPSENMEVDEQLVNSHLLKAYGEAMESEQIELADEIVSCLKEKASPTGRTLERLLFYLILALDKQGNYLRQESIKNYEAAFEAFYQIFPYARFAHFGANSAILEAIPADAKIVHIVDFQIGRGIQWPPLIESLARKGIRMLRLTSLKWGEEYDNCKFTTFEETKKQLCRYAMSFGLKLEVKEMEMEGLVNEIEMEKERNGKNEWLAFNCMAGLPQMGKGSNLKHVEYFLKTAKALITNTSPRGIITFGNGIEVEKWMECTNFSSFFEGQMVYFQALLESMEQFQLLEARIAMECLFVLPHLSSLTNAQEWEKTTRKCDFLSELGLAPRRVSRGSYEEARELVREGESSYWVRIQGEDCNQMVLGYMGTPLVRVSSWK